MTLRGSPEGKVQRGQYLLAAVTDGIILGGVPIRIGSSKRKVQREPYLLALSLSCYKWIHNQVLGGMPIRMDPKGVDCEIHIGWREERNIRYKVWKPLRMRVLKP